MEGQQPIKSPDNRFYWDGSRWMPVPVPVVDQVVSGIGSCLGWLTLGFVLLMVLVALALHSAPHP